jgi:hypothetical protein
LILSHPDPARPLLSCLEREREREIQGSQLPPAAGRQSEREGAPGIMAPGGGDRAAGQQQASGGAKHGCVCGFPVCACAGAAAVASAASSADMDRVAVAATEGQIGAVNDESWIAVDLSDDGLSADGADPGVALEDRPVFRTEKIKGVLLHPYRYTPPPFLS